MAAEGPGARAPPAPVTAPVGATPTPKAKVPVARWPSILDTVRQDTVYTPSDRGPTGTRRLRGWPGTAAVGPAVWLWPAVSRTCSGDSLGSGSSPNVTRISAGALSTVAPASGKELWRRA